MNSKQNKITHVIVRRKYLDFMWENKKCIKIYFNDLNINKDGYITRLVEKVKLQCLDNYLVPTEEDFKEGGYLFRLYNCIEQFVKHEIEFEEKQYVKVKVGVINENIL